MLLAVSIGNSKTKIGIFQEGSLAFRSSIRSDGRKTSDEYAILIRDVLALSGYSTKGISGAVISSVVPTMTQVMKQAVQRLYGGRVLTIGPGLKTGLNIKIDNPAQLGSDLAACAVAALEFYQPPIIMCYLGTATTMFAIDKRKSLIGGAIIPGVALSAEALAKRTAQLPPVDFDDVQAPVIGANTADCMRSGLIYGTASVLDGMIDRFRDQIGQEAMVVATGDMAKGIVRHCKRKITCNETLLLEGMRMIYEKNITPHPAGRMGTPID